MMKFRWISGITAFCLAVSAICVGTHFSAATASAEEPVRIMAMGDSITDGYMYSENGYRKYFCYDMQQKGITNFDMVGPQNNWTNTATYTMSDGTVITYDPAHAGYSGYTIQKTDGSSRSGLRETIFDTTYYDNNTSGNMLEVYDPNIIMLQIGTNDVLDACNDGITDRLESLIDAILPYLDEDGDMLFVSTIPDIDVAQRVDWLGAYTWKYGLDYTSDPETFTAKVQESIDTYNQSIAELVAKKQAAGEKIRFADVHSVVNVQTGLQDGVHPNEAGYACMGEHWADLISSYLTETPSTSTTTTTATTTSTSETTETTTTTETTSLTTESTTETTSETTTESTTSETETSAEETTISTSETTVTTTEPTSQKGDVNLDGTVQIADAVKLCRYLLGEERLSAAAYDQAELTGDGLVNGFDLASLKQQLFR